MNNLGQSRQRYASRNHSVDRPSPKRRGRERFLSPGSILGGLLLANLLLFGPVAYLVRAAPPLQSPEEGEQIFQQQCAACHTIGGGDTVGPDLENVTERRDVDWVENFIANPGQMIDSGDPTATQLLEKYGMPMPDLGLTDAQVETILAYLQPVSAPEQAVNQPAGQSETQTPGQPEVQPEAQRPAEASPPSPQQAAPTAGDPILGEQLFTGQIALASGGAHCIACHNVETITPGLPLNGGSLGPDLTHVAGRLGPGLTTTLGGLSGFPTMQGVYRNKSLTPEEQTHLAAFFKQADRQALQPRDSGKIWYWSTGAAGVLLLFGLMTFFWPRQRTTLAERIRTGGTDYEMD